MMSKRMCESHFLVLSAVVDFLSSSLEWPSLFLSRLSLPAGGEKGPCPNESAPVCI